MTRPSWVSMLCVTKAPRRRSIAARLKSITGVYQEHDNDNEAAKTQFLQLAEGTPIRYLDAGPLIRSRTIERLTFITSSLGQQLNSYPRMNWRLLTQEAPKAA